MSLLLARVGGGAINYSLTAVKGTYTLTGQSASFKVVHNLAGATGSYSYTGIAASFKVGHTLSGAVGAYTYTGVAATFKNARSLLANTGSYSLTGIAATFNYVAGSGAINYSLSAANGSYALSGQNATFKQAHTLLANNGSYTLNGVAATFNYVAGTGQINYTLTADAGSYFVAANDATFNYVGKNQDGGGGSRWQMLVLDKQAWKTPKKIKKIVEDVAKLNLEQKDAEIALRIKLRDIEWDSNYLKMQTAMQQALNVGLVSTLKQLQQMQLEETFIKEMNRLLEEQQREEEAIFMLMQVI